MIEPKSEPEPVASSEADLTSKIFICNNIIIVDSNTKNSDVKKIGDDNDDENRNRDLSDLVNISEDETAKFLQNEKEKDHEVNSGSIDIDVVDSDSDSDHSGQDKVQDQIKGQGTFDLDGENSCKTIGKNSVAFKGDKKGWRKYGGIIFGLSASFCLSLAVVMAKILSLNSYHPFNISMWRHCGLLYPAVPLFFLYQCHWSRGKRVNIFQAVVPLKEKDKRRNFLGLLCRALLGGTSVLFRFASIQYLSVGDSAVIVYSGPVFVIIVAHFCLGEKCGVVSILISIVTIVGVFVIVRPPILTGEASFDKQTMIGVILSLMSMICKSTGIIVTRKIREVHFVLMLLTHGMLGASESFFAALLFGTIELPKGIQDSILMFLVLPVLVFLGQLSIILALKFETAGPVSLIRTCDVIFSFIWQFLFLNVIPDLFSLLGALIVITGVCIQGFRKWVSTLPSDSSLRKKFSILLR